MKWSAVISWLTMHRQCAWCRRWLHVAPLTALAADRRSWTSHGICPDCKAAMEDEILAHEPNPQTRVCPSIARMRHEGDLRRQAGVVARPVFLSWRNAGTLARMVAGVIKSVFVVNRNERLLNPNPMTVFPPMSARLFSISSAVWHGGVKSADCGRRASRVRWIVRTT